MFSDFIDFIEKVLILAESGDKSRQKLGLQLRVVKVHAGLTHITNIFEFGKNVLQNEYSTIFDSELLMLDAHIQGKHLEETR